MEYPKSGFRVTALPGVISEESYMRIRVPGRFTAVLAILAFLCLLPASVNVAVAKPIGWNDVGPIDPHTSGDNDGVVLKNTSAVRPTVVAAGTGSTATLQAQYGPKVYGRSGLGLLFSVASRLDYWLFLLHY
jgi:hypothetical protein